MASVQTKTPTYIDLDLGFNLHPVTKDISRKIDKNAIITSVINLIKTRHGERPFHPEIGCQIYSLLFEPFTPDIKSIMERAVKYCLDNFEPRVQLQWVRIQEDRPHNALSITIAFVIVGTTESVQTNFFLERTI
jgi:phage baseplate assembly protein W